MTTDLIVARVAKLLALAAANSGATEAEQHKEMEIAQCLLLRHKLTEADVAAAADRSPADAEVATTYDTAPSWCSTGPTNLRTN